MLRSTVQFPAQKKNTFLPYLCSVKPYFRVKSCKSDGLRDPTDGRECLLVDVEVEAGVAQDAVALLPRLRSAVQLEEEPAAVRQQRRKLVGGVGLALPGNLQPEVVLIDVKRYTCRNRGTVANFGENCLIVTF